jgi:hypothetical protein
VPGSQVCHSTILTGRAASRRGIVALRRRGCPWAETCTCSVDRERFILTLYDYLACINLFVNARELPFVIVFSKKVSMESSVATKTHLIEYPDDLSECNSIEFGGRQLLYLCSIGTSGKSPFVVVLGFFSGQKEDFITKDVIEPVADTVRCRAEGRWQARYPQNTQMRAFSSFNSAIVARRDIVIQVLFGE